MATISRVNTAIFLDTTDGGWILRCRIIGRDFGGDTGTHLIRLANNLTNNASDDIFCNVTTSATIQTVGSVADGLTITQKLPTWKTFMDLNFPMAKLKAEGYQMWMYGQLNHLDNANGWDDNATAGGTIFVDKSMTALTDWDDVGTNANIAARIGGTNEGVLIILALDVAAIDIPGVGPPYDGTPESLVFRYNETTDCLQISYDGGTTFFDVTCSLATLQDALDVLADFFPTEQYDAGVDQNGFIRVTTGGSGAGTIDFDQTFQELLGTFVAEFWPPELWYEHVPKWF